MTDKRILAIVKSFRKGVLGKHGPEYMCFVFCSPLQTYMNLLGVKSNLVQFDIAGPDGTITEHWCLQLQDGRLLDPTASQFKKPDGTDMDEIYIGKRPDWYLNVGTR